MNAIRGAAIGIVVGAAAMGAQDSLSAPRSTSCPAGASVVATTWGRGPSPLLSLRRPVDTTFRFSVAERRWRQPSLGASLGAGVADSSRGWWLCASALVEMQNPMLVVKQAFGTLRLRIDLRDLDNPGRGSSPRP